MDFSRDELKEMVGKRITIDGERHRVAKVAIKAKTMTTEDGVTVDCEGVYKRGRGFFYDSPKKAKTKKAKVEKEAPAKKTTGKTRIKREVEEPAPKKTRKQATKKFAFDQDDTENLVTRLAELIRAELPQIEPSLQLGIHGGVYNTDIVVVTLGFAPAELNRKEIRTLFADRADISEVMHADEAEEEDDLSDLDDDEAEMDDTFEEDEEDDDEDDDEEEDEEEEADDEEAEAAVEEMVGKLIKKLKKASPNSNLELAETYIRDYLLSEEVEEMLGDELVPGVTMLTEKNGRSYLLAGFDVESSAIRLINLDNGKFRSRGIKDVARMEHA